MENKELYRYRIEQDDYSEMPEYDDVILLSNHREVEFTNDNYDISEIQRYYELMNIYKDYTEDSVRDKIIEEMYGDSILDDDYEIDNYDIEHTDFYCEWEEYNQLKNKYSNFEIYNLYAYIHSGISLSISNSYPYDCQWDSMQIGYVLADNNSIGLDTKSESFYNKGSLCYYVKNIIDDYNSWLNGEVYYYTIEKGVKCEHCGNIEYQTYTSCWGYYGYDSCLKGLKDELKSMNVEFDEDKLIVKW